MKKRKRAGVQVKRRLLWDWVFLKCHCFFMVSLSFFFSFLNVLFCLWINFLCPDVVYVLFIITYKCHLSLTFASDIPYGLIVIYLCTGVKSFALEPKRSALWSMICSYVRTFLFLFLLPTEVEDGPSCAAQQLTLQSDCLTSGHGDMLSHYS